MINAYLKRKNPMPQLITAESKAMASEAIWIDLLSPSKEEEAIVEQSLGFEIPTREEMGEIELSSRLYKENGIVFMTATMLVHADSPDPKLDPVTFVLTQQQLITIRYSEPSSFKFFITQLQKRDITYYDAVSLLIELLDAIIDRLADILELVGRRLDEYSKAILRPSQENSTVKLDYQQLLQQIGATGELNTKGRESLVTFNRLITFIGQTAGLQIDGEGQSRLITLSKDITALSDHANFLSTKVNFLLDATLGMVSIEQNNIIKIFSVAAVIFLPPTLIASIYGMNFQVMPELSWKWGYLIAVGLMVVSSWIPYKYFKHRKWL